MPPTIDVSARCSLRTAIYLVAASVVVSYTAAGAQESDLPGVEQVFAGYRANCDTFHTLHVIMRERSKYTEDYAAWQKAQADGMEESARGYLFDVLPTLGKLCDVSGPQSSECIEFTATLNDPTRPARQHLVFAYKAVQRAIRDDRWKLICYPQIDKTQLFYLQADPHEVTSLADKP